MTFDFGSYTWGIFTIIGLVFFMLLLFIFISVISNWYEETMLGKNRRLKQEIKRLKNHE